MDYEKLVLGNHYNGSIHLKDALTEAAKTLIKHFMFVLLVVYKADEIAQTKSPTMKNLFAGQL